MTDMSQGLLFPDDPGDDEPDWVRKAKKLGGFGWLTEADIKELGGGKLRVLLLMSDGRARNRREICLAAGTNGVPASEGLRRLRELREFLDVDEWRPSNDRRESLYQVLPMGMLDRETAEQRVRRRGGHA